MSAAVKVKHNTDDTTALTIADSCTLTLTPEQLYEWARFLFNLSIFAKALRAARWQQASDAQRTLPQ